MTTLAIKLVLRAPDDSDILARLERVRSRRHGPTLASWLRRGWDSRITGARPLAFSDDGPTLRGPQSMVRRLSISEAVAPALHAFLKPLTKFERGIEARELIRAGMCLLAPAPTAAPSGAVALIADTKPPAARDEARQGASTQPPHALTGLLAQCDLV